MASPAFEFCPLCGSVDVCSCTLADLHMAVIDRDNRIASLERDLDGVELELRTKRVQINQLRQERDTRLTANPRYGDAVEVLNEWKRLCHPGAREFGPNRVEPVIARLKGGYSKDDLIRAARGYSLKPYVVSRRRCAEGNREDWYADATLIYRDAKHVDDGLRMADQDDDLRGAMVAPKPSPPPSPVQQQLNVDPELSPIGTAALRMVTHGFYVLPCQRRGKQPVTQHGLKDAKRDPAAITRFWTDHPDFNVAVRTGRESGIVVLDVDGDEGFDSLHELESRFGALPPTLSVKTPRGGAHYYFRHPGDPISNTASYPGPGLDIRGDGGYVLAPPSVGPSGRPYAVDVEGSIVALPRWLEVLLRGRQERERRGLSPVERAHLIGVGAHQGARDVTLTSHVGWLLARIDAIEAVREMAHVFNEARLRPPLDRYQVDKVVDSLSRRDRRSA